MLSESGVFSFPVQFLQSCSLCVTIGWSVALSGAQFLPLLNGTTLGLGQQKL